MIFYLIPLLISAGCIAAYDIGHAERLRMLWFRVICIYTILLYGLSDGIGFDIIYLYSRKYAEFTGTPADFDGFPWFAPAFKAFYCLCKAAGLPFWSVTLIISTAINVVVFRFIRLNTKAIFTAALLYSCGVGLLLNVEIIRQALATAVFLLAMPAATKGKWLEYVALILVAMTFHMSAVIFFAVPAVYLLNVRFNLRLIAYLLATTLIFAIIAIYIEHFAVLFGKAYCEKIIFYFHETKETFNANYYIYHCSLMALIPAALMAYFKLIRGREIPFEQILCLSILITPGVIFFGRAAMRFDDSFLIFTCVAASALVWPAQNSRRLRQTAIGCAIVAALAFALSYETVKSMTIDANQYYPYKTVVCPGAFR